MAKDMSKWTDAELKAGYGRNRMGDSWDGKMSSLNGNDSLRTIRYEKISRLPGDVAHKNQKEEGDQIEKDVWNNSWTNKTPNRVGDKMYQHQRERDDKLFGYDAALKDVFKHHINGPDEPHPNTVKKTPQKPASQDSNPHRVFNIEYQ